MSEQITERESGAKSSGNLPPYECLTLTFLRRCAFRMKLGMHYGKHNWKKGAKDKEFILERLAHAVEHLHNLMAQIDNDSVITDDDAAAVCVNIMMAMEYQSWEPESQKINQAIDVNYNRLKDLTPSIVDSLRTGDWPSYDPKASQKASQ